jgi:hypothetical protein
MGMLFQAKTKSPSIGNTMDKINETTDMLGKRAKFLQGNAEEQKKLAVAARKQGKIKGTLYVFHIHLLSAPTIAKRQCNTLVDQRNMNSKLSLHTIP